jgi:DNA repair protein RecN (Recombination protein N)
VLSEKRRAASKKLAKEVVKQLSTLGMNSCAFETRISAQPAAATDNSYLVDGGQNVSASDTGWDIAEFYLSANLGEEVKPLAKVVSGGEVSRIMLALKSIFANKDTVPILVFDEIDVGVSGSIARKVGDAMKGLAASHQILAITHLPQIAGVGKTHLLVEKNVSGKRTVTSVRRISGEERAREVARLLSGDSITDTAMKNAKELILES